MPALSTNMMTRRKGERGTALDSPSVSELLAPNQLAARASNVSTLHGRRDNFVLASLHRSPHGVTCCTSLALQDQELQRPQKTSRHRSTGTKIFQSDSSIPLVQGRNWILGEKCPVNRRDRSEVLPQQSKILTGRGKSRNEPPPNAPPKEML